MNWAEWVWPASKLDQALELLVLQTGLIISANQATVELVRPAPPAGLVTSDWFVKSAEQLGVVAEPISTPYADVENVIYDASPAIFQLTNDDEPAFLVALRSRRRWGRQQISVLCPDLTERQLSPSQVRAAWCHDIESAALSPLYGYLTKLNVSHNGGVARQLAFDQLAGNIISGCWLFHPPPQQSLWSQIRHHRILWLLAFLLMLNFAHQGMVVAGWTIIGNGSFAGRFDTAWIIAWLFVTFTAVFFQSVMFDMQGYVATSVLRFLKSRLLFGAIQLDPDEIRHQGSGQFFGRVLESDMVQNFLVGGALVILPFIVMLTMSAIILSFGAGGWIHTILLVVWAIIAVIIGWRRLVHGDAGMSVYRQTTNALVENMIGHRTRLAQENRARWHEDSDKAISAYTEHSKLFDWSGVQLDVLIPRGWVVIGMLGIAFPFITGSSPQLIAISLGGIMLATQAFESLSQSMKFVVQAVISWRQVVPLLQAANKYTVQPTSTVQIDTQKHANNRQPLLMMRDVTFRYTDRGQAILKNCNLTIYKGDRLLLEGPSGGGKSTLANVLANLRQPQSGLLLLWGFDAPTVGSTNWRKLVVTAPQFQENHIFTDSLAFNLLMGRRWPAEEEDFEVAERVCRSLGLGSLLDRMPDGLHQTVGDGAWQLSFGERSRLFIARALLQDADLVILDESFGALDPESLKLAMECVLSWSPTVLVIAHP